MAVREIDKETVLMPIYQSSKELSCIYSLNPAASRVWGLINGKRTLAQIKKMLLDEFSSGQKQLDKELNSLISDLEKIKAIK